MSIKQRVASFSPVLILPFLAIATMFITAWFFSALSPVEVQSSTVTVNASVATSVTCSNDISSTNLGTLSSGSVSTSTDASSSMSCNVGVGCTLTIADAGDGSNPGLSTTSPAYLIKSPDAALDATTTIAAGTEGFGVSATSSSGGTGTLNINPRYVRQLSNSFIVGGLTLAGKTLASSTASISNKQLLVRHVAAISGTTQAGVYVDTITYSCASN